MHKLLPLFTEFFESYYYVPLSPGSLTTLVFTVFVWYHFVTLSQDIAPCLVPNLSVVAVIMTGVLTTIQLTRSFARKGHEPHNSPD